MARLPARVLTLTLAATALAACTTGRAPDAASRRDEAALPSSPPSYRPPGGSTADWATAGRTAASRTPASRATEIGAVAVGRWIAVDVVGDAEASRDLRRGLLEKTLVVNPGGRVILRGVDRAPGGGAASFPGVISGRVLTFADLPGAALLSLEGTRLLLTDPSGRTTRFVRDAE